jgi:signal transduction histidine kinase
MGREISHKDDAGVADEGSELRLEELRTLARALVEDEHPEAVLRRIAETIRNTVEAVAVNIERYPSPDGSSVALVTAGPNVASTHGLNAELNSASRTVVALGRRNERLGNIVIWRRSHADRVSLEAVQHLSDLADLAALGLRAGRLDEELNAVREEFARTLDGKYRLITGISEELKNRLGNAAEYVQLLETEKELTDRETRYIERSRESLDAAVRLINELVQLSRAETGRLELNPEPVNPGTLLRGIVRDYQLEIGTIGVEFELEMMTGLPVIVTDIDAVRQVLDNLLSNAVRYTPAGGRISVRADVRPGRRRSDPSKYVCFSIRDTGPGIGDQDLIFEAVYRVERRGGRPGFRLAISRRIARLLGGELTLESSGEGGSTFTLWLPGTAPAHEAAPGDAQKPEPRRLA